MYFYVPLSNILNAWFLHCAIFYIYINKRSKSVLHLWLHFTFDSHHVLIWFSLCERSLPPTLISSFSLYSAWSFFHSIASSPILYLHSSCRRFLCIPLLPSPFALSDCVFFVCALIPPTLPSSVHNPFILPLISLVLIYLLVPHLLWPSLVCLQNNNLSND